MASFGATELVLCVEDQILVLSTPCPVGTGEANDALNVGGGQEVFRDKIGTTLNFRTLVGVGLISVSEVGDTIEIDSTGAQTVINSMFSRTLLTTDVYLWRNDAPSNLVPWVMPFDTTLIAMSASGASAQTWQAQVHESTTLVAGATLDLTAQTSNFRDDLLINFDAGDLVSVFLSGTLISRPAVDLFFRRR